MSKKQMKPQKIEQRSGQKLLNPKIGIEATFSNAQIAEDIGEDGIKDYAASKRYEQFLQDVKETFEKMGDQFKPYGVTSVTAEFVATSKELGKYNTGDLRISFKKGEKEVFWVNVTRDPGVIEIQTMPFSVNDLKNEDSLASAVLDEIFGYEQCFLGGQVKYNGKELSANRDLGGGHINIDAASSGLLDPDAVFNLIGLWEKIDIRNSLIARHPTAARLKDTRTSRKNNFKDMSDHSANLLTSIATAFEKNKNKKNMWEIIVADVAEAYWQYPQVQLLSGKNLSNSIRESDGPASEEVEKREKQICLHNNAINIEHLCDTQEEARRVEFREFRAQESREEILECWELIQKVLMKIPSISTNFYVQKNQAAEQEEKVRADFVQTESQDQAETNPSSNPNPSNSVQDQTAEQEKKVKVETRAEASTPSSSPNPSNAVHLKSAANSKKHQTNQSQGRK